ncbi:MAG: M23 family metallopeptidase [Alphaproteobacteria bacterium]
MADSLREQAWRFVCATFPERQIYIRSDGRVQFFTFGPLMQTILAGITLAFLGWVAFTSVNVVFKDHIIAAKDKRYYQMQASYEGRVTDLQSAYDTLNAALITAEDTFHSRANEIETKQRSLFELIHRKQSLQAMVANGALGPSVAEAPVAGAAEAAEDSFDTDASAVVGPPPGADGDAIPSAQQRKKTTPGVPALRPATTTEPTTRPARSSFLQGVEKLAGTFFGRRPVANVNIDHPSVRRIVAETARLDKIVADERTLTTDAERGFSGAIAHLNGAIQLAGLDPKTLVARASAIGGAGGPLIPLASAGIASVNDTVFMDDVTRIADKLDELSRIAHAMRSVPLAVPVQGAAFDLSSGFGARIDPFTRRWAFHAGLDFTGPWGATIHATAPGTVVHAGPRGPYGNAVEIDHGMGIKTRFGHLSAVLVRPGMKVEKGSPVGKLGSSGRSTGPHVHYEVWFDAAAKDPKKFIKAGRYVLKE